MGEADTAMEARLAAVTASLNESRALLASCAQRLGVKEQEWREATMPTRCSTLGSDFNIGNKPAVLAFPTSGTMQLPAPTLTGTTDRGLLGVGGIGTNSPAGCSTHVLTSPREGFADGACAVNTEQPPNNSFPRFDGTNPSLWREKCLEFFTKFNICKPFWTTAARMHMDGKAKEWFEAYRLRQVVGAWPEFIDDVEAHFGVGDLPPSITILGAAHPSVDVHGSGDISPNVMHTTVESTEPTAADYEKVLLHIGGLSLFQEVELDSVDEVLNHSPLKDGLWYEELADCVVTPIGQSSLFLEQIMDTHHELEGEIDKPAPLDHGIPELCTAKANEMRRLGQNPGMLPEDIFSMELDKKLSLQVTQLATQIWDPGIPRFACTDWFCCYVIQVCRCLLHALLRRTSELLTQTSETCHAFLAIYSLITATTTTLEQALVLQIHDYQVVNEITWYMEVTACLMQLLAAQWCKNQPELEYVPLPPFWCDILLGYGVAQNNLNDKTPRLIYWSEVLQYLGLRSNHLEGSLSPDMCQLTGLWYFDVKDNSLMGTIPNTIRNCTSLQFLDLSYNQLTGEIPFDIGFLQVATLSLQRNKFSGPIPSVIGLMQALAMLGLSCNNIAGSIPSAVGSLEHLFRHNLSKNNLVGYIRAEFGNLRSIMEIDLSNNHLHGLIPQKVGMLQNMLLSKLDSNNITGDGSSLTT